MRAKKKDEIATAPEAPPSTLSKKLIELLSPTMKRTVITASKIREPVGLPKVSDKIKTSATAIPTNV
jgi:hypothetical protein